MSVANIFFMPDRILCLSDTLVYDNDTGRPAYLCDRKTFVYGRMAVVTRGTVPAGRAVNAIAEDYTDVDGARAVLDNAHALILEHKLNEDPTLTVETTAMGWSDVKGDLVAYRWELLDGQSTVTFRELPRGMHLAPGFNTALPPMPPAMDDARLVRVALAQHATAQQMEYNMCIGGVMHVTEVTADSVSQRIVGTYPDYDQHAEAFGCPNEEAVAAFRAQ